jgi:cytochrome P450
LPDPVARTVHAGELYGVSMRQVNTDPAVAGECPFALDPDRAKRQRCRETG